MLQADNRRDQPTANACRTVVQNTIHHAERWGILRVQRRKVARDRNLPNLITIAHRAWLAWLRLGPARPRPWGGGFISTGG